MLEYQLFGFGSHREAQLLEKDSLYVPAGWDSFAKIKVDFENQKICTDPDLPYEEVIVRPPIVKQQVCLHLHFSNSHIWVLICAKEGQLEALLEVDEDQEFLNKHLKAIESNKKDGKDTKPGQAQKGYGDHQWCSFFFLNALTSVS